MINADIALRLRLKALENPVTTVILGLVQELGINGDSVKRLTNVVERRLGSLPDGSKWAIK